jgi:hypothetical protein
MKSVRLVIREADQDWSGLVTRGQAERATAALNADPDTLSELDIALGSFAKRLHREQLFLPELEPGDDTTPGEAGVVIIDLAARMLVVDREEELFDHRAGATYFDGEQETEQVLNFTLASDWLITCDLANWRALATQRRAERAGRTDLDSRAVLYGQPLLEFVARETFAAYPRCQEAPLPEKRWDDETEESQLQNRDEQFVRKIHADWLLTPRAELAGQTPRHMLFATRKQVAAQMSDREYNWSFHGHVPIPLPLDSRAVKFAGIGTQEAVVYYEVVRDLIWSCWLRMEELTSAESHPQCWTIGDFLVDEIPRLTAEIARILKEPSQEFEGRIPATYLENERRRMPEGGSYRDHMIDPDCPCCQMLADMPGVGFWHLDGCNMDNEFAFDIYRETQEEWDEEQRRYEEFNRQFKERQEEKKRLEVGEPWLEPAEDSIWKRSVQVDDFENFPLGVRIFCIGCDLAELIVDIRDGVPREQVGPESQAHIDRLNRDFGNLREILNSTDVALSAALIEAVMDTFKQSLYVLGDERPKLKDNCDSLAKRLSKLLLPPDPEKSDFDHFRFDDDIPF